jgi:hypothetical protein
MRGGGPPMTKFLGTMAPTVPSHAPTLTIAPVVSNAPTAFYRQHRTVEAPAIDEREFRPAWRVKTKLMLLVECGRIDRHQLEAAMAFKGWCEVIGRQRTSAWLAVRVDGGRRPEGLVSEHQIDAARRLAGATTALGRERIRLLHWALIDDLPWIEIGRRIRLRPRTAIVRVVEAIAGLALWRAGQPVPSAPVTRLRIEPRRW